MKRIIFFVQESSVAKLLGGGVIMVLEDDTNIIDVIQKADKIINKKGKFPIKEYRSLLHMVYNPKKDKFYTQVGIHAHTSPGKFFNIRDNVHLELIDGMTITLIPSAGCIGDFEEPLTYEEFVKALKL